MSSMCQMLLYLGEIQEIAEASHDTAIDKDLSSVHVLDHPSLPKGVELSLDMLYPCLSQRPIC